MTDRVLVVTVAYRSDTHLPAFLHSIRTAASVPLRVVIVNNGPEPVAPLAPVPGLEATVLEPGGNVGYGAGINAGAATRRPGENWVIAANPDLEFEPGSIDELLRAARDPTVGAVGPLILTPDGEVYPSARRLPSLRTGVGHAALGTIWAENPWTRSYLSDRESPPRPRDAGWLSGSCLLLSADVFERLGGFDETYFMYFEDVDLGARIGKLGLRNRYVPSARVTHIGGASTATASRSMIRAHHESAYRYLSRKYRGWYFWPLRGALRAALSIRAVLSRR